MANKQFQIPMSQTPGGAGGGSGTVTSVTFTGDGVTLSNTPSSAVTTTGTLTATAATASGNKIIASPANGSSGALAARVLVAADLPVAASGTGVYLPQFNAFCTTADSASTFGVANQSTGYVFIAPYSISLNHVTVAVGTGVGGALMGIAVYDFATTNKLAAADGFSVASSATQVRTALNTTLSLGAGKAYMVLWTATTATTLTVDNVLLSTSYCAIANQGANINIGTNATATSGGNTPASMPVLTGGQSRVPLMYFD